MRNQGVIKTAFQNWKSYYGALKVYPISPDKFSGMPKIPKYCRAGEKEVTLSNVVKSQFQSEILWHESQGELFALRQ